MFTYPPRRTTVPTVVRNEAYQTRQERRKPELPGPYIYVSGGTGDVAPGETWQSPEWQHDFTQFGTNYVGFRNGLDGYVEFIGQLDLTSGGVTGTVAFTLPPAYCAISFSYPFPIFVEATTWQAGILQINGTTGEVTPFWPVEATAI